MNNVYSLFEKIAGENKHQVAIKSKSGIETYQTIIDEVERVAQIFAENGLNIETCIGIYLKNSSEFIKCYLAAAKYNIKLALIDHRCSMNDISKKISAATANAIIYEKKDGEKIDRLLNEMDIKDSRVVDINFEKNAISLVIFDELQKSKMRDKIFNIIFSSGSTGDAKGILYTQNQIANQIKLNSKHFEISSNDKILCAVEISHSYGIYDHVLLSLLSGATLYMQDINFVTPRSLLKKLAEEDITFFGDLPWMYDEMNKVSSMKKYDLSHVRYMICGGDTLKLNTVNEFYKRFNKKINQVYGLTELGYISFDKTNSGNGTIGKIYEELEYKFEKIEEERGLLHIKINREFMFEGYLSDEASSKSEWFDTLDIVRIDRENNLYYCGRRTDVINIRGNKIYPNEIKVLLSTIKAVKKCEVLVYNEEITVVIEPEKDVDIEKIRFKIYRLSVEELSSYKRPKKIYFIENMPKTNLGKIPKNELIIMLKNMGC